MHNPRTLIADELKSRLDIVDVVSSYLTLRRKESGYEGNCPFCDTEDPSLYISPADQTWTCSGRCTGNRLTNPLAPPCHGDVLSFYRRAEHITYGTAVRRLAAQCGLAPGRETGNSGTPASPTSGPRDNPAYTGRDLIFPGLFDRESPTSPYFLSREDADLKPGNLGYRGRIDNQWLRARREYTQFTGARQPRPGIIVGLHTTLQEHCELEYPDGERELFDAQGCYDGGEIIWTEQGCATAVIKGFLTKKHSEVAVEGVSTRGFCLLVPPGLTEPTWCWPRAPRGADVRPRSPFYYNVDGVCSGIILESFTIEDAGLLTEYRDISGVTVPVTSARRSSSSHRDRLEDKS